jgi:F-type H+-transporting ATPase subunit gamma
VASERDIKRRIKAVRNVQQITKAMKMVAAARIKKAEDLLKAARPYSRKLQEVMRELVSQMDEVVHPLMEVREVKRTGLLVVTSDKGLCGAYNNNLLKLVHQFMERTGVANLQTIVVGGKGEKFFRRRKLPIGMLRAGWVPSFALAQEISLQLTDWYLNHQVDQVMVFYTQAVSAAVQRPAQEQLLPLVAAKGGDSPRERPETNLVYEFEPGAEEALNILLPRYLSNTIYRILVEARVSELGARLKSMTNATDNADKLAHSLTLQFFRIRQENITKEILEIVGGAEALAASS